MQVIINILNKTNIINNNYNYYIVLNVMLVKITHTKCAYAAIYWSVLNNNACN